MTIQSSGSHTCLPSDILQAGVGAKSRKRLLCHFQDALAVSPTVGTGLALHGL